MAANIGVKLSEIMISLINLCDEQYLRLESILTKPWTKQFISTFGKLYMAEDAKMAKDYSLTTQIKPLFDLLLERLKMHS